MASAEIALACGLKIWVGCQDGLCANSDADDLMKHLPNGKADM